MGMLKFLSVRQMYKDCWIVVINSPSRITVSFKLQLSRQSLNFEGSAPADAVLYLFVLGSYV